jgi:hypothetical protein
MFLILKIILKQKFSLKILSTFLDFYPTENFKKIEIFKPFNISVINKTDDFEDFHINPASKLNYFWKHLSCSWIYNLIRSHLYWKPAFQEYELNFYINLFHSLHPQYVHLIKLKKVLFITFF